MTYKVKGLKKFNVALKTNLNRAISNAVITIKVNKRLTYYAKTNSLGVATFNLAKLTRVGAYPVTVTYNGNAYYNKLSKSSYVIVK